MCIIVWRRGNIKEQLSQTEQCVYIGGFCGFVRALIRGDVILQPEGCASFREAALGCCEKITRQLLRAPTPVLLETLS